MPAETSNESVDELEDLNKFTKLCAELECALASAYGCLDEVLVLKDTLLDQSIPCSVKVKLTLALGRLHRSMSDLGVPTGEITRLVKLYAVPWENKSKALKKLHQDYESKQHQLEIALKRLEMVGVQSMRMEKEKRIQNWEKLFAKLVGSKGHGQRWRFLIHQFKTKVQRGENFVNMYAITSDDEEDNELDERKKENGTKTFNDRLKRIESLQEKVSYKLSNTETSKPEEIDPAHSVIEEESEASIPFTISDNNSIISNEQESLSASTSQVLKKVRFDDSGSLVEENDKRNSVISLNQSAILPLKADVETADKECWTHEPDSEKMFHIRIYKTICKTIPTPWCTVVFDKQIRKSNAFKNDETNSEMEESTDKGAKKFDAKSNSEVIAANTVNEKSDDDRKQDLKQNLKQDFQEFVFKLAPEFETRNHDEIFLKISVHPENRKTMIAMTSMKFADLKLIEDPGSTNLEKNRLSPSVYQVRSAVNNSQLTFNKPCGEIHLICFYSKILLPKIVSRGTETLSIEEITDKIIAIRKKEFVQRLKSAGTTMTEKPIYTEEQMKKAKEELKGELLKLREEYEERIGLMISELNKENADDVREFINAATSPLHMQSSSMNISDHENDSHFGSSNEIPKPPKSQTRKSPKKVSRQKTEPVWGENLPSDFYERMEMFQEASQKHHQELKEKFNEKTYREMEKQLASQNRLDRTTNNEEKVLADVCLPALFMPKKTRNIYSSRARSYFHALGTQDYRITQPPSILQLPRLKTAGNNSELIGLYETISNEKSTLDDFAAMQRDEPDVMSLASTVLEVCDTDKINGDNDSM